MAAKAPRKAPSQPTEDHRVRVARQRRERMRAHLLESVMAVYPEGRVQGGSPTVIDDVVRHAGVSRGTFYKYFDSLDQAVEQLGWQLAVEMTGAVGSVYDTLTDAPMRTATGFQTFLLRAYLDHRWGAFFSHIGLLNGENLMVQYILADIEMGIETGDYAVASPQIAADALIGAKVQAVRRIISEGGDIAYIHAMTAMVLRSFGLSPSKSDKVVSKAFALLGAEAPGKISWWRAIDA
jgi:AcrR family transcriptional regulator